MFPTRIAPGSASPRATYTTQASLDAAAELRALRQSDRDELGTGWPRMSILMPVFNSPLHYLSEAVASALEQTYDNFELCIVDDASTASAVWPRLGKGSSEETEI